MLGLWMPLALLLSTAPAWAVTRVITEQGERITLRRPRLSSPARHGSLRHGSWEAYSSPRDRPRMDAGNSPRVQHRDSVRSLVRQAAYRTSFCDEHGCKAPNGNWTGASGYKVARERCGTLSYVGVDGPIVRGKEGVSWWTFV